MTGGTFPSWAVRGAKCICVKVGNWDQISGSDEDRPSLHPVLDGIYTIDSLDMQDGYCAAAFLECEFGDFYWLERFRPLVTRTIEQDISEHFKRYLDHPEHEPA